MAKTACFILLILISLITVSVFADSKKKKHVDPNVWSPYSCCHDLDDTPHRPGLLVETHFVPEFYYPDTLYKGDTTFAYVCYDARDSVLNADTVIDFANVHYLSLFKSFIDYNHTYRNEGKNTPLPISLIVHRYDRISTDKWSSISYPENKYAELNN